MPIDTVWQWQDLLLASLVVLLGMVSTLTRDRRLAILLFVVLGLVLALLWARLYAPDVALAEAAIGAGVSGALLVSTLRGRRKSPDALLFTAPLQWLAGVAVMLLGVAVAWGLLSVLVTGNGWRLGEQVYAHLPESGVSNPVTAVLLNFRAYDTLLELAVLLVAVLGIRALGKPQPAYVAEATLTDLAVWLVPVLIVMAGYVLWAGAHAPGGAFQAGALLGGAGIVLVLAGKRWGGLPLRPLYLHGGLVVGTGIFLLVGVGLAWWGEGFLRYPEGQAGVWILLIEVAATLSIGMTLVLAFMGGIPPRQEDQI
ncbi:MAG: hydrogenase subunit MbhD domain-containing protein [Thiothrix litoralis]